MAAGFCRRAALLRYSFEMLTTLQEKTLLDLWNQRETFDIFSCVSSVFDLIKDRQIVVEDCCGYAALSPQYDSPKQIPADKLSSMNAAVFYSYEASDEAACLAVRCFDAASRAVITSVHQQDGFVGGYVVVSKLIQAAFDLTLWEQLGKPTDGRAFHFPDQNHPILTPFVWTKQGLFVVWNSVMAPEISFCQSDIEQAKELGLTLSCLHPIKTSCYTKIPSPLLKAQAAFFTEGQLVKIMTIMTHLQRCVVSKKTEPTSFMPTARHLLAVSEVLIFARYFLF